MMVLIAALLGLGLVILALIYHLNVRAKCARQVKLIRGIQLLDRLDDLACDCLYNQKKGPLPAEDWAYFVAEAEKHGDLVDAVIQRAQGFDYQFVDSALYRKSLKWTVSRLGRGELYGPEGNVGPEPWRAQVQVLPGRVAVPGRRGSAPVLFFHRHILLRGRSTKGWYGRATIILRTDVPSPKPGSVTAQSGSDAPARAESRSPAAAAYSSGPGSR
jgi:hypothetical protein